MSKKERNISTGGALLAGASVVPGFLTGESLRRARGYTRLIADRKKVGGPAFSWQVSQADYKSLRRGHRLRGGLYGLATVAMLAKSGVLDPLIYGEHGFTKKRKSLGKKMQKTAGLGRKLLRAKEVLIEAPLHGAAEALTMPVQFWRTIPEAARTVLQKPLGYAAADKAELALMVAGGIGAQAGGLYGGYKGIQALRERRGKKGKPELKKHAEDKMVYRNDNIHTAMEKLASRGSSVLAKINPDTAKVLRRLATATEMEGRGLSKLRGPAGSGSAHDRSWRIRDILQSRGTITPADSEVLKKWHTGKSVAARVQALQKLHGSKLRVGKGNQQFIVKTDSSGNKTPIFDYDVNYNLANTANMKKMRAV